MIIEKRNKEIKAMVCEILDIDETEMTETSLFQEEHDADSLRAIEILAGLARNFNANIPQDELSRMIHLKALIELVDQYVEK